MERRIWNSETKLKIVLEGLKTGNLTEICNKYQISQTQYYKWRDQFLENGQKVFEGKQKDKEAERLKGEVFRLKAVIGDLTAELKKNDF